MSLKAVVKVCLVVVLVILKDGEAGNVKLFRCTAPITAEPSSERYTMGGHSDQSTASTASPSGMRGSTAEHGGDEQGGTTTNDESTSIPYDEATSTVSQASTISLEPTSERYTTSVQSDQSTASTTTPSGMRGSTPVHSTDEQGGITTDGSPSTAYDYVTSTVSQARTTSSEPTSERYTTIGQFDQSTVRTTTPSSTRGSTARHSTDEQRGATTEESTSMSHDDVTSVTPHANTTPEGEHHYIFTLLPIRQCGANETRVQVSISPITAHSDVHGSISFPRIDISDISFNVTAGSLSIVDIPTIAVPYYSIGYRKDISTIVITSSAPVSLIAHLSCLEKSKRESTTFQITDSVELGREYRIATYQSTGETFVGIAALNRETAVRLYHLESVINITLSPYESFIWGDLGDLTGVQLVADEPVFVLAGTFKEDINIGAGSDIFYESMTPVNKWRKEFRITTLSDLLGVFAIRVLPWNRTTTITWTNGSSQWEEVIGADGLFAELWSFPAIVGQVIEITSNEPVLVVQVTANYKNNDDRLAPAISMITIPPIGDTSVDYIAVPHFGIEVPAEVNYVNHVTIWLPPDGRANLVLINGFIPEWVLAGTTTDGWQIFRTGLEPHTNILENTGPSGMRAVLYAWQRRRSYAHTLL